MWALSSEYEEECPVCGPCRAEAAGAVLLVLPEDADLDYIGDFYRPNDPGLAPNPLLSTLEIWANGLAMAAEGVREVVSALKTPASDSEAVAHALMGDESVDWERVKGWPYLRVRGLRPAVARRLVEQTDMAYGPELPEDEVERLIAEGRGE